MDTKKMMVIAVVAVLAVAAVGVVLLYQKDDGNDDPLASASWDEIVEMANGQSVVMGFYADTYCVDFFNTVLKPRALSEYGVTVTYESYGPLAAGTSKTEMDNGVDTNGSFDLIWGNIQPLGILIPDGEYKYMYDENWVDKMPNSQYLTDSAEQIAFLGVPGYKAGTAAEFSGGQTLMVYNTDYNTDTVKIGTNTIKIPYNCVVLLTAGAVSGFLKVAPATTTTGDDWDGSTKIATTGITSSAALVSALNSATAVDIDSVRSIIKTADSDSTVKGNLLYGLPTDFTTLLEWAKIYKGQFTYPDPNNTSSAFHTDLLLQAMIFELTWNNETAKTGWKVAADKDANFNRVQNLIDTGAIKNEADYITHFGYLFEYLEDLHPYTSRGANFYISSGAITPVNNTMVGNAATDKDFSDATVMIALTTCTALDMRTSLYTYDYGTFTLDTGVNTQYYLSIPKNSSSKAGAMVVANLFLDPEIQALWYQMTGNVYNIDVNKTAPSDGNSDGNIGTIYDEYFGYTASWTKYLPKDRVDEVTKNGILTGILGITAAAWESKIGVLSP